MPESSCDSSFPLKILMKYFENQNNNIRVIAIELFHNKNYNRACILQYTS